VLDGLDEEALLIGFARRFAPYKRAALLFKDSERLAALFSNSERPLRVFFAGKAHPRDELGKQVLKSVVELTRKPEFAGKVFFLEDYDMDLARRMVQGVDVWLNNPIRGLEASGTSGMKAAANGVLNLSVADGWWIEGRDGENGWSIGDGREYPDEAQQDELDSAHLCRLLEDEVLPLFFERDALGVPRRWLERCRQSLATIPPTFSTERMVAEYRDEAYVALAARGARFERGEHAELKRAVAERARVARGFADVRIASARVSDLHALRVGQRVESRVEVELGALSDGDVLVELVLGHAREGGDLFNPQVLSLTPVGSGEGSAHAFEGAHVLTRSGSFAYACACARAAPTASRSTRTGSCAGPETSSKTVRPAPASTGTGRALPWLAAAQSCSSKPPRWISSRRARSISRRLTTSAHSSLTRPVTSPVRASSGAADPPSGRCAGSPRACRAADRSGSRRRRSGRRATARAAAAARKPRVLGFSTSSTSSPSSSSTSSSASCSSDCWASSSSACCSSSASSASRWRLSSCSSSSWRASASSSNCWAASSSDCRRSSSICSNSSACAANSSSSASSASATSSSSPHEPGSHLLQSSSSQSVQPISPQPGHAAASIAAWPERIIERAQSPKPAARGLGRKFLRPALERLLRPALDLALRRAQKPTSGGAGVGASARHPSHRARHSSSNSSRPDGPCSTAHALHRRTAQVRRVRPMPPNGVRCGRSAPIPPNGEGAVGAPPMPPNGRGQVRSRVRRSRRPCPSLRRNGVGPASGAKPEPAPAPPPPKTAIGRC
jgi:hypothetical protein